MNRPGPEPTPIRGSRQSQEDIGAWLRWLLATGTPETTRALRRYYLGQLSMAHPRRDLRALTADELADWLASHSWAANTRKSARSALRSFYGWLLTTGRISASPAHLLPPVRIPRARPKPTPETDYRAALAAADERARLAIRLAAQCGMRRGEIARVRGDDVIATPYGPSLRVIGKGGHVREIPLEDDLAGELRALGSAWAFASPHPGHDHLTPHHVATLVTRYLPKGVGTHSLRHRAVTTAYAATRDLRAVQEFLGHSRPETTAGYVQVPDDAIRAAMRAAAS